MKPLFCIGTDDLLTIRYIYIEDIHWWNNKLKESIDINKPINYPYDYIQFKEKQIQQINIELIKRGITK